MYILSKSSSSGSTKRVETIQFEPEPNTYASALLLRNQLLLQDTDFLESYNGRMIKIQFSRDTLTFWKSLLGSLFCVYCMKKDLQIEYEGMLINENQIATLEHIIPISHNGDIFNLDNVVCACGKCNHNRGNNTLKNWLKSKNITKAQFDDRCKIYFDLNK